MTRRGRFGASAVPRTCGRRLAPSVLVAVGLLAAACAATTQEPERSATYGPSTAEAKTAKKVLVAPPILLVSRAGRQRAAPGKSCVLTVGQGRGEGPAECHIPAGRVRPASVSVVRPRELVALVIPRTEVIRRPGCVGRRACGGWATLRPLGCKGRRASFFRVRGGKTRWRAAVPPGPYELEVSIDFTTADDLTGDATGVLGLLVDRHRRQRILPFTRRLDACPSGEPAP